MKLTVVKNVTPSQISVDDCTSDKYYGVDFGGVSRGFISQKTFRVGDFFILSSNKVTIGNGWDYNDKSLKGLLKKLKNNPIVNVYCFDTSHELFTWLIEQE